MTVTVPVRVPVRRLQLEPGSAIAIAPISWEEFEAILAELGEQRNSRIIYYQGTLRIMAPMPAHERPHRLIGKIVEILLDAEERDWEDFGSTTFRRKQQQAGLEPDTCFYIQNAAKVRDCMEPMDLERDPPPDLAIEADVTSPTTLDVYQALQIPEVWVYKKSRLAIYVLQAGQYVQSTTSPTFPNQPILELIPDLVQRALKEGSSQVLRQFRRQVTGHS